MTEPAMPPEQLDPVTITESDSPVPDAPQDIELHGEQDQDAD